MFMDELLAWVGLEGPGGGGVHVHMYVWICVSAYLKMYLDTEGKIQLCIKPPEFPISLFFWTCRRCKTD